MVRPLVKRQTKNYIWLIHIALYGMGAVASSALLGSILGSIGSVFIPGAWFVQLVGIIAVLGLFMSLCDFQIMGLRTPTTARQTSRLWWPMLGSKWAMLLWGLDLGLGFTTIRIASLYWIVLFVIIVLSSPVTGAMILCAYGTTITLNLIVGLFLLERVNQRDGGHIQALQLWKPLKKIVAALLFLWSIWMLLLVMGSVLHIALP